MVACAPRSTCNHCGSLYALDHRVPVLPSTAALAGVPAFSVDEAVAGLPWDSRVGAAPAGTVAATTANPATRTAAIAMASKGLRGRVGRQVVRYLQPGLPEPDRGHPVRRDPQRYQRVQHGVGPVLAEHQVAVG